MKAQSFASKDVLTGFLSNSRVSGHTHDYYRYPARFSPEFVRSVITSFSHRGDTVIDPFMGGGTTAVEALAAGRNFIGSDLNPLATFITKVKTTPLTRRDRALIRAWLNALVIGCGSTDPIPEDDHVKNVPWWMKRIIGRLLASINTLNSPSLTDFARCSVLRTAQWALDCRRDIPSTQEFLAHHRA
ncbi:MAG: DNA methyltransferase, partial [Candidatus Angelobacter sp.]